MGITGDGPVKRAPDDKNNLRQAQAGPEMSAGTLELRGDEQGCGMEPDKNYRVVT